MLDCGASSYIVRNTQQQFATQNPKSSDKSPGGCPVPAVRGFVEIIMRCSVLRKSRLYVDSPCFDVKASPYCTAACGLLEFSIVKRGVPMCVRS
jgi:hypothetical protein